MSSDQKNNYRKPTPPFQAVQNVPSSSPIPFQLAFLIEESVTLCIKCPPDTKKRSLSVLPAQPAQPIRTPHPSTINTSSSPVHRGRKHNPPKIKSKSQKFTTRNQNGISFPLPLSQLPTHQAATTTPLLRALLALVPFQLNCLRSSAISTAASRLQSRRSLKACE